MSSSRTVGRVAQLWRYPVKSMAGESLDEAALSWHGLAGDRRWAFVRDGLQRSGFPWLTMRERPTMAHYQPRFAQPEQPDRSAAISDRGDAALSVAEDQGGLQDRAERRAGPGTGRHDVGRHATAVTRRWVAR